ncbi:hypothetical protein HAX54_012350 [Datura stramonium]|uniref:Uncharacterized protein n=1 Tax=Datura stramonium TaxID=4076 RepID=A0ABS8TLH1_DATST|nr:hypothetical protein [Datura stramonium]
MPQESNFVKLILKKSQRNQVADDLAKQGADLDKPILVADPRLLPTISRGAYHLDGYQLPSFRIRFD